MEPLTEGIVMVLVQSQDCCVEDLSTHRIHHVVTLACSTGAFALDRYDVQL